MRVAATSRIIGHQVSRRHQTQVSFMLDISEKKRGHRRTCALFELFYSGVSRCRQLLDHGLLFSFLPFLSICPACVSTPKPVSISSSLSKQVPSSTVVITIINYQHGSCHHGAQHVLRHCLRHSQLLQLFWRQLGDSRLQAPREGPEGPTLAATKAPCRPSCRV